MASTRSAPGRRSPAVRAGAVALAVVLAPVSFLAAAAAAATLPPDPDSSGSVLAVQAGVLLLVLGFGTADLARLLGADGGGRSRARPRGRVSAAVLGVAAAAVPLARAASGHDFDWALTSVGAVGLYLLLLAVAGRWAALASYVAAGLALLLIGTAVLRDVRPVDLHGPAPVLSPRAGP